MSIKKEVKKTKPKIKEEIKKPEIKVKKNSIVNLFTFQI